jgi:hypothetical protein
VDESAAAIAWTWEDVSDLRPDIWPTPLIADWMLEADDPFTSEFESEP